MKKVILGILLLILVLAGGIGYRQISRSSLLPSKNLGRHQVMVNQTGRTKTIKVKEAGYYDVLTIRGDQEVVAVGAPIVGGKLVGQFFEKNQPIDMEVNGKIELQPAKLEKFSSRQIKLENFGTYFIGDQIPPGTYQVHFVGELSNDGIKEGVSNEVLINVNMLGGADDQVKSYTLGKEKVSKQMKLNQRDTVTIKSNTAVNLILIKK